MGRPALLETPADVTVHKRSGKITVTHLYAAQDAGTTVNLASVENQMTGLRPKRSPIGPPPSGRVQR